MPHQPGPGNCHARARSFCSRHISSLGEISLAQPGRWQAWRISTNPYLKIVEI
jgi:hypothetical protein